MEQEIIQLENAVRELSSWKEARMKERLTYPIDILSRRTILNWPTRNFNGLPVFTGRVLPSYVDLVTDFLAFGLEVSINKKRRAMLFTLALKVFTVNSITDVITNSTGSHNLLDGDKVAFTSTGTLPAGLSAASFYYVVSRTGTTFKVSLTSGGSAVDITDAGSGTHYFAKI